MLEGERCRSFNFSIFRKQTTDKAGFSTTALGKGNCDGLSASSTLFAYFEVESEMLAPSAGITRSHFQATILPFVPGDRDMIQVEFFCHFHRAKDLICAILLCVLCYQRLKDMSPLHDIMTSSF